MKELKIGVSTLFLTPQSISIAVKIDEISQAYFLLQ